MSLHRPSNYSGSQNSSRTPTRRERIINAVLTTVVLILVLSVFAAPGLIAPLVVGAVAIGLATNAWRQERGARGIVLAILWIAGGIAVVLVFASDVGGTVFGGVFFAALSVFTGLATGWRALFVVVPAFAGVPLAGPVLIGAASGLIAAALQTWRRWKLGGATTDSLIGASLSGDRWARSWSMIESFAVGALSALLATVLLEQLGLFAVHDADTFQTVLAMFHAAGGTGGGSADAAGLLKLILLILALLGILVGFALVVGICAGIPFGALAGALSWERLMHGSAAATTRDFVLNKAERRATRSRWIMAAALRGASEGILSGMIAVILASALHLADCF